MFQDGASELASLLVISHFRPPSGMLVVFLSRYLCAIGLLLYLAFDGRYHHFTLHYQAGLLAHARPGYGALTLCGPAFLAGSPADHHNSAPPITIWAPSCSLAATGEILVSFFSSL